MALEEHRAAPVSSSEFASSAPTLPFSVWVAPKLFCSNGLTSFSSSQAARFEGNLADRDSKVLSSPADTPRSVRVAALPLWGFLAGLFFSSPFCCRLLSLANLTRSHNNRVQHFTSSLPCAQLNRKRLALSLSQEIGDQGHAPSLAAAHQQTTISCVEFMARHRFVLLPSGPSASV